MENNSPQELQKFIAQKIPSSQKEIILFNAAVTYYRDNTPVTITSEIQIITLPKEMVLYVLDFVNDNYQESEIYSTRLYQFEYSSNNTLEVKGSDGQALLIVAAIPG
jgi:hypothetical protein